VASQLKHLAREAGALSLSLAQLTLAREYGFESWPKLKIFVETQGLSFEEKLKRLIAAATTGRLYLANHLLKGEPKLATFHIGAACVTGEVEAVRRMLAGDPKLATASMGRWSWKPLDYVAHSFYHQESAEKREALLEIARLLLERGADPNSTYTYNADYEGGKLEGPVPVLYGPTGLTNFPELAELLLKAGALPDERTWWRLCSKRERWWSRTILRWATKPSPSW
jgi:hypothetical protein